MAVPRSPSKKSSTGKSGGGIASSFLKAASTLSPTKKKKPSAGGGLFGKKPQAAVTPFGNSSNNHSSSSGGTCTGTTKPSKINVTAGSSVKSQDQTQARMSDKAKTAAVAPKSTGEEDWDYIYQLAVQYDQLKLQEAEEIKNPNCAPQSEARQKQPKKLHEPGDKKNIKNALEGLIGGTNFTVKGDWLKNDYFDQYLVANTKFNSLIFDFSGQGKLFKRFDRKDEEQKVMAHKFVEALLKHPKAGDITALSMSNAMLPDAFFVALSEQCIEKKGLPKLQVMNFESNLLGQDGAMALSKGIADPDIWRRLQILKLENQKMPLGSDAEDFLGEALLKSPSLVVVSLRVQGGLARQQINNSVATNMDKLRQARRHHAAKTGTLKERKRNEMEAYFDKIASNSDPSVTDVDIVGNIKFLGLNPAERTKTGAAFATNTTVKTLKMVKLQLDDAFAEAFGNALATNTTLEKVCLDSNSFTGAGMKSLMEGLGKNTSIVDFMVRHQTKTMASSDEQALPALLADNKTVIKLGVDVRNQMVKTQLDRKTNESREYQRKLRVAQRNQK